jgi:hypothetical protein
MPWQHRKIEREEVRRPKRTEAEWDKLARDFEALAATWKKEQRLKFSRKEEPCSAIKPTSEIT